MLRCPRRLIALASTTAVLLAGAGSLLAQDHVEKLGDRAPRFFAALTPKPVLADVARTPALQRRVVLDLRGSTLAQALQAIGDSSGLRIAYSRAEVPADRLVHLQAKDITVAAALTEVLLGLGVDAVFGRHGQVMLVRRDGADRSQPSGALTGRVTDAATGHPVPQAEVFLAKTAWRTMTDTNGWYYLANVDPGAYTEVVRRLGYAKQSRSVTVRPDGVDTIDVVLEPRATRLDELVSTATGSQRRREVPNDITVLNADSLMRTQPVKSVTDLLEGRVPGLLVQHTSGAPGDPSRLRLRGASSPNLNNDPIVVVDGVRVYAQQSAARSANLADIGGGATAYATPSPLDYIDPNSIETIEVVKGPSAATLYGQDAANGVIVITTKKGKAGPTRWTMSAEHGVTDMDLGRYPERVMRWGHIPYRPTAPVICPLGNVYSPPSGTCAGDSIVHFQLLNEPDQTPFGRGQGTAATLGVSGGVRSLTYSVTGSYDHDLGLLGLPGYELDRYTARVGQAPPDWMRRPQQFTQWGVTSQLTAQLGLKAELSFHANVSQTDQQRSDLERQLGDLDATYLDRASGIYYVITGLGAIDPLGRVGASSISDHAFDAYYTKVTSTATALTTGAALNWRPWAWLTTTADAGINVIQRVDGLFLPRNAAPGTPGTPDSAGSLSDGQGRSLLQTLNLRANATQPLGRGFSLRLATGADYTSQATTDLAAMTRDIPAGQEVPGRILSTPSRAVDDRATFGWFVEPAVGNSKLNINAGLRLDGGSSYGSGLKLPTFPKLGFSYLLSDEPFFPFKRLFQSFRVRAAYGRASRQPGPTDRLRLYSAATQGVLDEQSVSVTALQTLGNTQLRPERTAELEGGLDADLLDSRVHLEVTGYRKTTNDALLSTPVPPSLNVGSIVRNIGVTRNTGLDITLAAQLVRSGPLTWSTNLYVEHRRDEVVRLGPGVEPFYVGGFNNTYGFQDQRVAPGYPLFGYWAPAVVGYADLNGNGVIEPGEIVLGDTAVYRGSPLPDYTATLSSSVGLWHGAVQLTADLLYDKGLTQNLPETLIMRQVTLSPGRNDPASSPTEQALAASTLRTKYYWYQQLSTTRLNAVSLTYKMPQLWARRLGAEQLSVSVQGRNLGLWSNYRGADPNVNGATTGNLLVDNGALPQPRTWQMRINATY